MPRRAFARSTRRKTAAARWRRWLQPRLWPDARTRVRWWRAFRRAAPALQVLMSAAVVLVAALSLNWIYQVIRKPSELFFPVSATLYKSPAETWRQYAPIFRKHATSVMTPDLLAAIAQVEGSGNPLVRTYWR